MFRRFRRLCCFLWTQIVVVLVFHAFKGLWINTVFSGDHDPRDYTLWFSGNVSFSEEEKDMLLF